MNLADHAKYLQGGAGKLARSGLLDDIVPDTSPSNESAAYDAVDDVWMSTYYQADAAK